MTKITAIVFTVLMSFVAICAYCETSVEVYSEKVVFFSEGTRLSGELFYPKSLKSGERLPGIVLCHGWGGLKRHLSNSYAPAFAARGYVVLAFDYRGWGDSDSRLVSVDPQPALGSATTLTLEVKPVRELVDPLDQLEDIRNALNFIEGDAHVDKQRIGIWGTSLGGGLAVVTAARDDRVRCVVSQVGVMDGRVLAASYKGGLTALHRDELLRTRGEFEMVPEKTNSDRDKLKGTPYYANFARFSAVQECRNVKVPLLLIDVEFEELFDIRDHSGKVYSMIKDDVVSKHKIVSGAKHYDIYRSHYKTGLKSALYWFDRYLK